MSNFESLASLGWQPFFQQQLSIEEWDEVVPARIVEQHRSVVEMSTVAEVFALPLRSTMPDLVVGDWLLLDDERQFIRLLERKTCFFRKAAGSAVKRQLISANVDTAFIVCSLNEDFNLNRIERYLALVNESGAEPVVVLSKADQCEAPEAMRGEIQSLDPFLMVAAVNCLSHGSVSRLGAWTKPGATIAVIGSSGVGKSTLVNTLLGEERQDTGAIRADDAKGRHTTTSRALIALTNGALILDTPGMREVQLADSREAISATFSDIEDLAERCRYSDCAHRAEPGCAVREAIESRELDERRLENYLKLLREDARNSASLAEKRASSRALGKYYKKAQRETKKFKGRDTDNGN